MTTYIGQASHDENNKYTGGKAGNQSGTELNTRAAYLYNWHTLIRFKDANRALKCGQAMAAAVANVNIGYDQYERNTILPLARKVNWDLSKITTPCECDCSSLAGVCGIAAGIPESTLYVDGNLCYTGNQVQRFRNSGMVDIYTSSDYVNSTAKWQVGDILVSNSHTVVVVSGPVASGGSNNAIDGMSIDELAQAVIAGRFGTGDDRRAALGDKYDAVQKRVNEILSGSSSTPSPSKSIDEIAQEVIAGKWGTGDERKVKLTEAGYDYSAVQAKVNALLSGSSTPQTSVGTSMLGIDVSSHNGNPFNAVTEQGYKDSKFVIVKATQGTTYTNPAFDYAYNRAAADGKCLGTYHYAGGNDPAAEAQYYFNKVKHTIGKAIPVIDWEEYQNNSWGSTDWVYKFVKKFYELAGIYPMIYTGSYVLNQVSNCKDICKLWVAGYPKDNNDWTIPNFPYKVSPWSSYTIWQFTSGAGKLDRNTTPLTPDQWNEYAAKGKVSGTISGGSSSNNSSTSVNIDQLAQDVIAGKYGTGDDRKAALGANYDAVQKRVNELLGGSSKKPVTDAVVNDVLNGKYGNGDTRKQKLEAAGYDYAEVQAAVNKKVNSGVDIDKLAREVIAGKYGTGEARKKALGSNYDAVQKRVNELLK